MEIIPLSYKRESQGSETDLKKMQLKKVGSTSLKYISPEFKDLKI